MAAAREHKADIIGISALLTTTMGNMRGVIQAVRAADDMPHMRVMVGGAAVTKEFAEDIGADGWAPDAASAVLLARGLVAEARGRSSRSRASPIRGRAPRRRATAGGTPWPGERGACCWAARC